MVMGSPGKWQGGERSWEGEGDITAPGMGPRLLPQVPAPLCGLSFLCWASVFCIYTMGTTFLASSELEIQKYSVCSASTGEVRS